MVKLQATSESNPSFFVFVPKDHVVMRRWKKGQKLSWGIDDQGRSVLFDQLDIDNSKKK